jgi:predicted  nucleic acid-binding Zn-ribbon protein
MKAEKIKKQIETLKDEWDRLSLYVSDPEDRMDKIEEKIERLEIILNRQETIEKLGI